MGYMKLFLENVAEVIHDKQAKVGDEIEVETDTPTGKKTLRHTVSLADMQWVAEMYGDDSFLDEAAEDGRLG